MTTQSVGERVRALLNGMGNTPAWLSRKSGLQRSTITRMLEGSNPRAETLAKIAPWLGVTTSELVEGTSSDGQFNEARLIGARVEALLVAKRKTRAWLATRAGVDPSTITRLIKGQRHPTAETLASVAPVLGVTVSQLVGAPGAEERVDGAMRLVSREHLDGALRQVVEFEREASEHKARAAGLACEVEEERAKRRLAEARAEESVNADRYREALVRAVADVAALQTELRRLLPDGVQSSKRFCVLASVGDYLGD